MRLQIQDQMLLSITVWHIEHHSAASSREPDFALPVQRTQLTVSLIYHGI